MVVAAYPQKEIKMPVTKTVELFTFDELSEKVKQKVIEKERESVEFYDDFIINGLKQTLGFLGFDVDTINYSVSYSQGDYAVLLGDFKKSRINKAALAEYSGDNALLSFADRLSGVEYDGVIKIQHTRRNIYSFEFSYNDEEDYTEKAEDCFRGILNDINYYIYCKIRDEVDYQSSDEVISKALSDYDNLYFQDGRLYHE
jgi:hypothetical protein